MALITQQRRRRWDWLRSSLADQAGAGHDVDQADIDRLPAQQRARARTIVAEAKRLFDQGDRGLAIEHARAGFRALEEDLGPTWLPPAPELPDAEELDRIQGKVI